jgi:hypothetical protein
VAKRENTAVSRRPVTLWHLHGFMRSCKLNLGTAALTRQVDSHFCKIKRRCGFLSDCAQSGLEYDCIVYERRAPRVQLQAARRLTRRRAASRLAMARAMLLLLAGWVALLLCCAVVGSRAEQGEGAPVVPPHHPGGDLPTPSVWGPQEVEAWLFAEGFGFLREPFEGAQINGRTLLAMRDHTLDVEFNLEPSERRAGRVSSRSLRHSIRVPATDARVRRLSP